MIFSFLKFFFYVMVIYEAVRKRLCREKPEARPNPSIYFENTLCTHGRYYRCRVSTLRVTL